MAVDIVRAVLPVRAANGSTGDLTRSRGRYTVSTSRAARSWCRSACNVRAVRACVGPGFGPCRGVVVISACRTGRNASGGSTCLATGTAVLVVGAAVGIASAVHKIAEAYIAQIVPWQWVGGCESGEGSEKEGEKGCGVRLVEPHCEGEFALPTRFSEVVWNAIVSKWGW